MNRWDEIQATARDIASNIHVDPEQRNAMADDLVKLCCLIVDAVGKGVAVDGESDMGMTDDETAHARYLTGERIQTEAKRVAEEASSAGADLERYERPTGHEWCVCGHHPNSHHNGTCTGQLANGHACAGGPCTEFRAKYPEPVWQHVDRRPVMFRHMDDRGALYIPPELAARCNRCNQVPDICRCGFRGTGTICNSCGRQFGHRPNCNRSASVELGNPDPVDLSDFGGGMVTAAGQPCVCIPVPTYDSRGRQTGWDQHPSGCTPKRDGERCNECNRTLRFGHMIGCSQRATCCHDDVARCPWSGVMAGGCCYPKNGFCPKHH
ncbi:hypothetical protein SEA_XKCD426_55 [Streptomyces phage Xkcd426]|nr:hypothetical protein SEA_XKCD426_55 [Streptomyces phage Xkcd426]